MPLPSFKPKIDAQESIHNYSKVTVESELSATADVSSSTSSDDGIFRPIADKENRQVLVSRLVMIVVLLLAAGAVAYGTWFYTSGSQLQEFESSFEGFANEIIKVSQINANARFEALKSLALSVQSSGLSSPEAWPFVTVPSFYFEGQFTLEQMGAQWIVQTPLISEENKEDWEEYASEMQGWRHDTWEAIGRVGPEPVNISECIFRFNYTDYTAACDSYGLPHPNDGIGYYAPVWGVAVPVYNGIPAYTNNNAWADPIIPPIYKEMVRTGEGVISEAFGSSLYGEEYAGDVLPDSYLVQPIYEDFSNNSKLVSFLTAAITWNFFDNILSNDRSDGVILVLENPCGSLFTFRIDGPDVVFLGSGDLHDPYYDYLEISVNATDIRTPKECRYIMHLYPSQDFENQYRTNMPAVITTGAILIFTTTAMFFIIYDCLVQKRQNIVLTSATRTGALVQSLFPKNVHDRLMNEDVADVVKAGANKAFSFPLMGSGGHNTHKGLDTEGSPLVFRTKPIADYYPNGTIMVADLSGFEAWSSEREPAQVFTLLETIFNSFDRIGKKRRIFKVETFGDCYVASAGVPVAMHDHAVHMARFAVDCRREMLSVVRQMEVWLGPDTGDLNIRIGIHSGPVTGGVLRGEKSRFQLFGNTMDVTFALEEKCIAGKIHVSQATADLLKGSGKAHWLTATNRSVATKGSKEIETYWLNISTKKVPSGDFDASHGSYAESYSSVDDICIESDDAEEKKERLINWSVDNLMRLLKMIVAMHEKNPVIEPSHVEPSENPLVELKEIINLRDNMNNFKRDPESIKIPDGVKKQLHEYVSSIAKMYRDNDFHNFEHACHVEQAVTKLLSRVVTAETIDTSTMTYKQKAGASDLHDTTFGLTSDPIIQFACALSALIHDADHPGVPNSQLVKEKTETARLYKNKSVAEQNSVDLAWNLLMQSQYRDLRNCIYINQTELERFRQLVVNSVMATDIVDKELNALRRGRWNKAFSVEDGDDEESKKNQIDRKATIVVEHIVQAADVSHMMQHWNIYTKWNEKFFFECYQAYLCGRAENDPSEGWYKGEMGFFDFYVIPLAKKLADCGVFGVSSDEYLNYAMSNRREWEEKGRDVVARYVEHFKTTRTEDQDIEIV